MQAATDMQIEMTKKENEEPVKLPNNSTIISTNGLKITSKLNPDAKEFYPAYLLRQKIMREIGDATLAQPLHFAHNSNVLKVIKLEGVTAKQMDALKKELELNKSKDVERSEAVDEMKIINKAIKANVGEKENECDIVDGESRVEADEREHKDEDVRASEEDSTDLENFEDAEGEPMLQLAVIKAANKAYIADVKGKEELNSRRENAFSESALNNRHPTEYTSDEENREQFSEQGSNETLNEYKYKEDTESVEVSELSEENELAEEEAASHELPQILEEIKESTNRLCGDGDVDAEVGAEAVCECAGVGDGCVPNHIVSVEAGKLCCEADTKLPVGASHAPPNTSIEVNAKSTIGKARLSKGKTMKEKSDKKKSEKRTTLRKLANISLSLRGKNSAHHAEKSTPRSSSAAMTRTKRLTESLHNLTSGLKSIKSDSKKTEASCRLLPRSATNIPRLTAPRARVNALTRATTETNGMNYKTTGVARASNANSSTTTTTTTTTLRNAISLQSASSSEQNLTTKPTVAKKPLSSKFKNAAAEKLNIPKLTATKSKDSVGTARPRGTHASTLRQSEAQKRRSLFPNDDAESNIELSQFLFK